jgi:2-methylcitrate dehydratase PrpD
VQESAFKPWPSCRAMQSHLTAFEALITEHDLQPDEIEEVVVRGHFDPVGNPPQAKFAVAHPDQAVNMEFSIPFVVADLAFRLPPGPRFYRSEYLDDPRMRAFRDRVRVVFDQESADVMRAQLRGDVPRRVRRMAATVEIRARGHVYRRTAEYARGDPWSAEAYLDDEALRRKFLDNAVEVVPDSLAWKRRIEALTEVLFGLEKVTDVSELTALLSPSGC